MSWIIHTELLFATNDLFWSKLTGCSSTRSLIRKMILTGTQQSWLTGRATYLKTISAFDHTRKYNFMSVNLGKYCVDLCWYWYSLVFYSLRQNAPGNKKNMCDVSIASPRQQ